MYASLIFLLHFVNELVYNAPFTCQYVGRVGISDMFLMNAYVNRLTDFLGQKHQQVCQLTTPFTANMLADTANMAYVWFPINDTNYRINMISSKRKYLFCLSWWYLNIVTAAVIDL